MPLRVTATGKDSDGDITKLCGSSWSTSKATAIREIETGTFEYFVNEAGYRSTVVVRKRSDGTKYLTTLADKTNKNNLDNLDDC